MKKELAVRKESGGALAAAIRPKRGMENFDMTKLKLPFLHLCQDLSEPVKAGNAEVGDIVNLASGKNYGKSIEFTPLYQQPQRIKWIDFEDGGGMDCVARDGKFGSQYGLCSACKFRNNWGENPKGGITPPECSEYDNFIVMVKGEKLPAILVMGKTKQPAAVKLANMILLSEDPDSWYSSYILKVGTRTKGKQSWAVYEAPVRGKASTAQEIKMYEATFTALYAQKTRIADDMAERVVATEGGVEAPTESSRTAPRKAGVRPGKGRFS